MPTWSAHGAPGAHGRDNNGITPTIRRRAPMKLCHSPPQHSTRTNHTTMVLSGPITHAAPHTLLKGCVVLKVPLVANSWANHGVSNPLRQGPPTYSQYLSAQVVLTPLAAIPKAQVPVHSTEYRLAASSSLLMRPPALYSYRLSRTCYKTPPRRSVVAASCS